MAISTSAWQLRTSYNEKYWASWEEFEEYYILLLREKGNWVYYTPEHGGEIKFDPINHHPELKWYEVWCEGYRATGEHGTATLIGKAEARNFAQACHIVMCTSYLEHTTERNNPNYTQYFDPGRWDYDPSKLSIWNCGLFWSEALARKSNG